MRCQRIENTISFLSFDYALRSQLPNKKSQLHGWLSLHPEMSRCLPHVGTRSVGLPSSTNLVANVLHLVADGVPQFCPALWS